MPPVQDHGVNPPPPRPEGTSRDTIEVAAVLERAGGPRLAAAERLAAVLPTLLGDGAASVELYLSASGTFTALARVASEDPAARRRLSFWCARAGARALAPAELGKRERTVFRAELERCSRTGRCGRRASPAEGRRFFTAAGLPADRTEPAALPELALDVEGPEWEATRWDAEAGRLFVPGALAPPAGDSLRLSLRLAAARNLHAPARVAEVRTMQQAGPGAPAGFTLQLSEVPTALGLLLDQRAQGEEAGFDKRRIHPRYPVRAPVQVMERSAPERPEGPPPDVMENLSMGGAFVRSSLPLPRGTPVRIAADLPTGDLLRADAEVMFASERGMGLRWTLDAAGEAELEEIVARVAAMSRRALVVDDDAPSRSMLAEALQACGFEVLCAEDGLAGLEIVLEELLSLDLLVTDLWMPRMDGEGLLRTIRDAGGESDLAIVVVSGRLEPGLEKKLQREGADAVLEKELGPVVMAQAAAAILDRKRAGRV